MTLHLSSELEEQLQKCAAELGRTTDDVAREALGRYIEQRELLEQEITEAEEEADRDGWLSQDEVLNRLKKRLSKAA